MKTFNPLSISSKYAICGLPLRLDTYKFCTFGCKYCFSNYRKVCEFEKTIQVANPQTLKRMFEKIFNKAEINETNLLDKLLSQRITLHCGGMSDPFQPCEKKLGITKQTIDICNEYEQHILFSTKSDTTYSVNIRPDLHTFQLSVTHLTNDKRIESNVTPIEKRIEFYRKLKRDGFKVGIRIQPFIPGITTDEIIDVFHDADHFTIEGLKMVPQSHEQREYLLKLLNLESSDFTCRGLLNLKPELRLKLYEPLLQKLNERHLSYSIADNDLRYIGNNRCCCGDSLVEKSTDFNTTALIMDCGKCYSQDVLNKRLKVCGISDCKASCYVTSNRTKGCTTVQDFYDYGFDKKSSPFSPKFTYTGDKNA